MLWYVVAREHSVCSPTRHFRLLTCLLLPCRKQAYKNMTYVSRCCLQALGSDSGTSNSSYCSTGRSTPLTG